MNKLNDGGPAFGGSWDEVFVGDKPEAAFKLEQRVPGMSLRDYFAAAALTGFCANSFSDGGRTKPLSCANNEEMAELAYAQADAMLAQRAEQPK